MFILEGCQSLLPDRVSGGGGGGGGDGGGGSSRRRRPLAREELQVAAPAPQSQGRSQHHCGDHQW